MEEADGPKPAWQKNEASSTLPQGSHATQSSLSMFCFGLTYIVHVVMFVKPIPQKRLESQKEGRAGMELRGPELSNDTPFGEIEVATTC
jgi:hypothetical protein